LLGRASLVVHLLHQLPRLWLHPTLPLPAIQDNMTTTRLTADELRERVLSNTGADGRLKDDAFHLDARAVAILSKRHQISKNFGFTSMLSFSTTVLVSWEAFAV